MNHKLRLAFFSPFRPQKSGIADYSEELLPHLAAFAEIDLIAGPYRVANEALRQFRGSAHGAGRDRANVAGHRVPRRG